MGGRGSGRKPQPCAHGTPISKCTPCLNAKNRKRYTPKTRKIDKGLMNKEIIKSYKLSMGGCCICGITINDTNVHMFALDHREPSLKLFNLSQAKNKYSPDMVKAECAKCDLMCHNCHHLKTHKDGDHKFRRNEAIAQPEYLPLLLLMQDAE
jgi:ribosomal protein S30